MANEMSAVEKIEKIADWLERECLANNGYIEALRATTETLKKVESGELVEVIHDNWIGTTVSAFIGVDDDGNVKYLDRKAYRCGKCRYGTIIKSKYCPSCGAKMDKAKYE